MTTKKQIIELVEKLKNWNKEYYIDDNPSVSDATYDAALNELIKLEKENPDLILPDSPTQKVGGESASKFKKHNHRSQMLSLSNAFNLDDLSDFDKQIKKEIKSPFSYFIEPKIDGLSISLIYKNGKFTKAVTRGDGLVGEDVTENARQIQSIPKLIENNSDYFEVRGEIYLSKSEFEKINVDRLKNGEQIFANTRNAAAGTMRQLDPKIVFKRKLDIWVYYLQNKEFTSTHEESLNYLKKLGFPVNNMGKKFDNISDVYKYSETLVSKRDDLEYDIDGAVIKINEFEHYNSLGQTSKFPKWATALKFPAEIKDTTILDIFPTVGRTGRITYKAKLEPVTIAGTTVRAATLHNADFIINKDIRIGAMVSIKKAGDIIPEIVSVNVKENNFKNLEKWKPSTICPECGGELEKFAEEVDKYCINISCPRIIIRNIEHFVSRKAMNIQGLSIKLIEKFYNNKIIKNIDDIYKLEENKNKILSLDKIGEKLFQNLIESINQSKQNSLDKLLFGLGIRHIGEKNSKILSKKFKNIDNILAATFDEMTEINDLGPIGAKSIIDWTNIKDNIKLIYRLKEQGLNFDYLGKTNNENNVFQDMSFVITGRLSKPRDWFVNILDSFGVSISNSVSKKTNYLLAGEEAGSKLKKAKDLNVKIISEAEFNELVGDLSNEK